MQGRRRNEIKEEIVILQLKYFFKYFKGVLYNSIITHLHTYNAPLHDIKIIQNTFQVCHVKMLNFLRVCILIPIICRQMMEKGLDLCAPQISATMHTIYRSQRVYVVFLSINYFYFCNIISPMFIMECMLQPFVTLLTINF